MIFFPLNTCLTVAGTASLKPSQRLRRVVGGFGCVSNEGSSHDAFDCMSTCCTLIFNSLLAGVP